MGICLKVVRFIEEMRRKCAVHRVLAICLQTKPLKIQVSNKIKPTELKRTYAFLAILAIILFSNCSEISENTDPVLGIWYKAGTPNSTTNIPATKEEWIFNDVYLGRYQVYTDNKVTFYTDFGWEQKNGLYTIKYPGTDKSPQNARMVMIEAQEVLQDEEGNVLALRQ